jgi:simple sugar transport system permease protein
MKRLFKKRAMTAKEVEKQFEFLRLLFAVCIALSIAFAIILFISDDPLSALYSFVIGPVITLRRVGNIIEKVTPLLFTGMAVCLIFSANQTNMAVEGGFLVGALGATIAAICLPLPPIIHPAVCIALGGIFGAAVCGVPAGMYVRYGAKPVVSSLMMNYVCLFLTLGIVNHVLRDPAAGFSASYRFAETARLSKIMQGAGVHSGIFIGIIIIVLGYLYLYKSKWGYEIRIVGKNMDFAAYSGMPVKKILMNVQLLGGFLSGMGGAVEVLGMFRRFEYAAPTGLGFDGILVGIIAGYNPKFVPLAALFLAYIRTGADVMSRVNDIPIELVNIIQAIIIMLVCAERFLYNMKHKRLVLEAERNLTVKKEAA